MSARNSKLTKCKVCGEVIAKSASNCPKCGAKQPGGGGFFSALKKLLLSLLLVFVGVTVMALVIVAIEESKSGQSDTKVSAGDMEEASPNEDESSDTEAAAEDDNIFTVGETATFNDVSVTFVDLTESESNGPLTPADGNVYLTCEFEIENNSDDEIRIGLEIFDAYADDYAVKVTPDPVLLLDKETLGANTIAAGKKFRGIIGYEVSKDWSKFELISAPYFWSDKETDTQREIVFVHNK